MWLEKPEELWPEYSLPVITPEIINRMQTNTPTAFMKWLHLQISPVMIKIKDFLFVG